MFQINTLRLFDTIENTGETELKTVGFASKFISKNISRIICVNFLLWTFLLKANLFVQQIHVTWSTVYVSASQFFFIAI